MDNDQDLYNLAFAYAEAWADRYASTSGSDDWGAYNVFQHAFDTCWAALSDVEAV